MKRDDGGRRKSWNDDVTELPGSKPGMGPNDSNSRAIFPPAVFLPFFNWKLLGGLNESATGRHNADRRNNFIVLLDSKKPSMVKRSTFEIVFELFVQ